MGSNELKKLGQHSFFLCVGDFGTIISFCFRFHVKEVGQRSVVQKPTPRKTLLQNFEESFGRVLVVNCFEKLDAKFIGASISVEKNEMKTANTKRHDDEEGHTGELSDNRSMFERMGRKNRHKAYYFCLSAAALQAAF
jgi:hypothetical protein